MEMAKGLDIPVSFSKVFTDGGKGGADLAEKIVWAAENVKSHFAPLYPLEMPIKEKIKTICREIYGAKDAVFFPAAEKALKNIDALGFSHFPICMAKTQYSLSDNPLLPGRPENFDITIKDMSISAGAGFIIAYTGDIISMPGLSSAPSFEKMDIDAKGTIIGLF